MYGNSDRIQTRNGNNYSMRKVIEREYEIIMYILYIDIQ